MGCGSRQRRGELKIHVCNQEYQQALVRLPDKRSDLQIEHADIRHQCWCDFNTTHSTGHPSLPFSRSASVDLDWNFITLSDFKLQFYLWRINVLPMSYRVILPGILSRWCGLLRWSIINWMAGYIKTGLLAPAPHWILQTCFIRTPCVHRTTGRWVG